MTRRRRLALAAAGAALTMWAIAGVAVAADQTVTIKDLAFAPPTVTIEVGETVTFANEDSVAHTATDADGGFDTERIAPGASVSVLFDIAGTTAYACSIHPEMTGTVVVQAAGAAPTAGDAGATAAPTDTLADLVADPDGALPVVAVILTALALSVVFLPARLVRRKRR